MDSAMLGALIVAVPAVLATTVMPFITARQANTTRRAEKIEDWAHQAELSRIAKEELDNIKRTGETTHALVNSHYMAAQKRELEALKDRRVTMLELQELKKAEHIAPNGLAAETIKAIDDRIAALTIEIEEQAAQQKILDEQTATAVIAKINEPPS